MREALVWTARFGMPLALSMAAAVCSAQQPVKVLPSAALACAKPFAVKDGGCTISSDEAKKLPQAQCNVQGLAWTEGATECKVVPDQFPAPTCTGGSAKLVFNAALKLCEVKDETPRSVLTDFMGDCIRVRILPANPPSGLQRGVYKVMFQRPEGQSDKMLTLAPASGAGTLNCSPSRDASKTEFDIKASDLQALGADRSGWAFGVLALPYKFHTDDRSFGSGVSLGPYFGRRWGTPGSAYTFAVAATIGNVKGEIKDGSGNITSTPDLQAFSLAAGWMFDVAKSPEVRPFKIGLFVGSDWVGADKTVQYKHNRKPWLAFQIGFDFLD